MKVVLIADRSALARKVWRRTLEEMNLAVVEAADGEETLRLCRETRPDAAIVDSQMPGPPVLEVIAEISSLRDGEKVSVLYCADTIRVPEMMDARRAGARGVLLKPLSRAVLEQKLAAIGVVDARVAECEW